MKQFRKKSIKKLEMSSAKFNCVEQMVDIHKSILGPRARVHFLLVI